MMVLDAGLIDSRLLSQTVSPYGSFAFGKISFAAPP